MSCAPATGTPRKLPATRFGMLADEGFRLFFPLSAFYLSAFPLIWVLVLRFDLPLAREVPPPIWHAHEMIVGGFGAALIGFLTTAAPEWTDTEPLRGRPLWGLAVLWALGRLVGVLGWDGMAVFGALADLGWLAALIAWLVLLSIKRRTDRLLAFVFWLLVLGACIGATKIALVSGDIATAQTSVHLAGFAFLGLLGVALARITVPVTNLVLDPSETSSPFRPHPGRLNLAPGLVLVAMAGQAAGLSEAVTGYMLLAAGAAFMDRVAEGFVGREAARAEILMLAASAALAGAGLMLTGAGLLGASWLPVTGLHLAFMGGLGLGVYAVFCIAGLMHTDRPLGLPLSVRLGALALVSSSLMRIAPDLGFDLPGPLHSLASLVWAAGFLTWMIVFWPAVSRPGLSAATPTAAAEETLPSLVPAAE